MRRFKQAIRIGILPTMHLCLCAFTALFLGQDNWDWMFVSLLDAPLLLLMVWFNLPVDSVKLTIAGTMWWLCVGIALSYIVEWLKRRKGRVKQVPAVKDM